MSTNWWIMSDTHFGHDMLIRENHRPKYCEETMINSLHVIKEEDVLIHLGDFSFYRCEYWHKLFMKLCKGKKWFTLGNHDRRTVTWYLKHGWDFVASSISLKIYGKDILFSHHPIENLDNNVINIHGHLHENRHEGEFELTENHILVKMEHEYKPFQLKKLVGM